jgi:tripeptidyl-peptidase-1
MSLHTLSPFLNFRNFSPNFTFSRFNPEIASGPTAMYYGGGGFSNVFPAPAYQKPTTDAYIKSLGTLNQGLYNTSGRGIPDLSAQGNRFVTVLNGTYGVVSGTSASCPLTAGIFSLINDKRISAGMPKLGFINPTLYKKGAQGLNDITIGSNKGCNTNGFPAKAGW